MPGYQGIILALGRSSCEENNRSSFKDMFRQRSFNMVKPLAIPQRDIFKIIEAKHWIHLKLFTHEVSPIVDTVRISFNRLLHCTGGYFPTPYTHQPDLVMTDRRHSRDQYLNTPKYSLANTNVDRTDELRKFHQVNGFDENWLHHIILIDRISKLSQEHRDTYIDRSGTLHSVEHFTLPVSNQDMYETNLP